MLICDNNTRCEHASDFGTSGGKKDERIHRLSNSCKTSVFISMPVSKICQFTKLIFLPLWFTTILKSWQELFFFLLTPSREFDVKATTLRTFFSTMYFCFKYWSFLKRSIEVESEQQHVAHGQHQIKSLWWMPCFSTLCQTNANVYVIWNALTYCWSHVNKHTG